MERCPAKVNALRVKASFRRLSQISLFFSYLSLGPRVEGGTSLDQLLEQARAALSKENLQLEAQALADASALAGSYDLESRIQAQRVLDKPISSPFTPSPDDNKILGVELQLGQKLPTGAAWSATVARNRIDSSFPPSLPPSPSLGEIQDYQLSGELKLSQDLWRDFGDPRTKKQKQILETKAQQFKLSHLTLEQKIQFEVEQSYWRLVIARETLQLSKSLVDKARSFVNQMKAREALGRSDAVDTAAAEVVLVNQESQVLKVETRVRQLVAELRGLLRNRDLTEDSYTLDLSDKNELATLSLDNLFQQAREKRSEFEQLRNEQEMNTLRERISEVSKKPRLAVFVSGKLSSSASKENQSLDQLKKTSHPQYALGVEMEYTIGSRKSAAEIRSAQLAGAALSERFSSFEVQLKADLEKIISEIEGSQSQMVAAQKRLNFFRSKVLQEKNKLTKSKSESVLVLRYEMEVLAAEMEYLSSLENFRSSFAGLKYLTHSYPRSSS